MGRRAPRGPIAFMPSDAKYLGSRDLRGIPALRDGERMRIRVVEVVEIEPGEVINGRAEKKAFWSMVFDRPPDDVLLDVSKRSQGWQWQRSRKEWRFGPEVAGRLAMRVGDDVRIWPGAIIPVRLERTTFGREDVYGVRPVPLPWEADPGKRREAMGRIAAGNYRPPCLTKEMLAKWDADHGYLTTPEPAPERQPGEDEPEEPEEPEDTQQPPDDWRPGDVP